jgi:hypothetical protein
MLTYAQAVKKLSEVVPDENMMSIDNGESYFIPIETLEELLDLFDYSTRNFQYQIFKDGYANLCVAASLELILNYQSENGEETIQRSFVGAANFALGSLGANSHFLATAKSECEKNAAQDAGKWFGRGLNVRAESVPDPKSQAPQIKNNAVKLKPDVKIMQKFADAVQAKDEAAIRLLENMYEIGKEEPNVT